VNQAPSDLYWIPDSVANTAVRNRTFPGGACRDCESFPPFRGGRLDRVPARNIHPSRPDPTDAMPYVLNVSLTFGYHGDAEQAETQLATTVFKGLVSSWSEVEAVRW